MITSHSTVEKYCGSGMDTAEESPLDVLSRAATMVQENQQASLAEEPNKQNKQTTKWKRDRRRLPEYSRKSDPKIPEVLGVEPSSPEASISNGTSHLVHLNGAQTKKDVDSGHGDTPLDMSVRQRGLPPSYDQTMSNPGYRSPYKTIVIYNGAPPLPNVRDELPYGISMCEPDIEEHFRRSLGKDYHTLFQNSNTAKEEEPPAKPPPKTTSNVVEFMDEAGLSVDDHFAKALGDTWKKLNQKEELKGRESESNLLSAKN
ncbi:tondu-domain-containing Growth Inhibitor isoform X1 [Rhynchophorus ferrugineus]|uniref:tondu-domain-containing Growth Inhibitor isoform X1 n=1 Tax=Rhynchophorus ferrugineus TaxID=354439 RepID=UPI003FCE28D0